MGAAQEDKQRRNRYVKWCNNIIDRFVLFFNYTRRSFIIFSAYTKDKSQRSFMVTRENKTLITTTTTTNQQQQQTAGEAKMILFEYMDNDKADSKVIK